ncbi:D-alanine--D-alanine ligase [Saliniradius amylolyticus]|uniref:D-alanine--D-alanine ligase n=1 Tax=Saliniradius amylolyticus TaxID=2183582 RepID=A0A2S2E6N5_9ALTE|nr:D-alanine--D-alanine ligase [Saliniradius amylolyticus]AWL12920.1 D-alanine--D-alanine ligase [Saliniradius amylolyticus]
MTPEQYGKVAVMLGGDSAERAVSLKSGQAVLEALQQAGVDAFAFDPSEQPLLELTEAATDRVLIMLHGRGGEDGVMQGALEQMGLPYTGSGVLGSALAMDKVRTKQIWQALDLPTPAHKVVHKSRFERAQCADIMRTLGGVVMVKPAREGSSLGMAKVTETQELADAIEQAFTLDERVLLEQFIQGREFTVALLSGQVLPSVSMTTPRVFYDYQAKYEVGSTEYFCPSGLSEPQEQALANLARQAFEAVDASGWGRVDFMQDEQGHFYLLEVNTVPGMTAKSLVPMAAKQAGLNFEQLVMGILATATRR